MSASGQGFPAALSPGHFKISEEPLVQEGGSFQLTGRLLAKMGSPMGLASSNDSGQARKRSEAGLGVAQITNLWGE